MQRLPTKHELQSAAAYAAMYDAEPEAPAEADTASPKGRAPESDAEAAAGKSVLFDASVIGVQSS